MANAPKVYVGSAVWRSVDPLHLKSLLQLLVDPHYGYFPQVGDALIERARGMSASYFLRKTDAEVHLSLDSDIIEFKKEAIDQMCEQTRKYDIVGGVYICRSVARTFPATFFEEGVKVTFAHDPTPVPVKWVATGCLAVHRRVFEKMAETMPLLHGKDGDRAFWPFYQTMIYDTGPEDMGKILLSEDYAFSQRAKDLGFTSYINPAIRLGHLGQYAHRLEDMAQDILQPQALTVERSGRYWRIECEGLKETPESMGRLPEGKGEEIRQRFENNGRGARRRNQKNERKALTTASP